jgi:Ran GTPase-activating protein (RanGAP) involved in mRNA processing and transport
MPPTPPPKCRVLSADNWTTSKKSHNVLPLNASTMAISTIVQEVLGSFNPYSNVAPTTVESGTPHEALALNSRMDFITLARLLRNEDESDEVKHLSLYRIDLDYNTSFEVVNSLKRFTQVEMVYCEGDHVDVVIAALFQHENIERVAFCGVQLDPSVVVALGRALSSSHKVHELTLTVDMPIHTTQVLCQGINSGSSHLKNLDLSQCNFVADAISVLATGFFENKHLESLKLENCRLEDEEVAELVQALQEHPTLRELSLRLNYCETDAIQAIATLLESQNCLEHLDISQQNPGVLDLSMLANALHLNTTLKYLAVRESYLLDAHLISVAQALTNNTSLEELHLEACDLGDTGFGDFLKLLPKMKGVRRLYFRGNRLKPSKESLLKAMESNQILQVLDLDDEWSSTELQFQLTLNRCGRRFLAPNTIALSMWPVLFERVKYAVGQDNVGDIPEADVLYCLLHGPALLER